MDNGLSDFQEASGIQSRSCQKLVENLLQNLVLFKYWLWKKKDKNIKNEAKIWTSNIPGKNKTRDNITDFGNVTEVSFMASQ